MSFGRLIHFSLVYTCKWNCSSISSVQFSSVAESCPTLCDLMNRNTPGLPVYHQLLEFTQTQLHRVSDAIQPSHPLSSPFLLPPITPTDRWRRNTPTKLFFFMSSAIPFSSCPQSFPASGSFQMSQLFASDGQSIGISASRSVLSINIQDWFPL